MWLMTDSRDGLPPLPDSDLSSELHGIEPLLLLHPRVYQEYWQQKGVSATAAGSPKSTSDHLPAAVVVSRAFRWVLHATARHQVIRNMTIQPSGLDSTSPIPQNQSLSWKWAGVAARRLPIGLCDVNTLTELSSPRQRYHTHTRRRRQIPPSAVSINVSIRSSLTRPGAESSPLVQPNAASLQPPQQRLESPSPIPHARPPTSSRCLLSRLSSPQHQAC